MKIKPKKRTREGSIRYPGAKPSAKPKTDQRIPDDVREVEDVTVGIGVGRLVGLQGEGAVVEGQPAEVHVVGVVEAPRRLLATPLVLPFCGGDVAAETFASLNLKSFVILGEYVLTVCLPDAASFPFLRISGRFRYFDTSDVLSSHFIALVYLCHLLSFRFWLLRYASA